MTARAVAITLLMLANLLAQPAKSKSPAKTVAVVIQGTLTGPDGVPLQLESAQLQATSVFAMLVPMDEEPSASVNVRSEDLDRFHALPDAQGHFRLRINRADVPKDQKLRLMLKLPVSGDWIKRLKKGGLDILIDIATAPPNLDLGEIVIGSARSR